MPLEPCVYCCVCWERRHILRAPSRPQHGNGAKTSSDVRTELCSSAFHGGNDFMEEEDKQHQYKMMNPERYFSNRFNMKFRLNLLVRYSENEIERKCEKGGGSAEISGHEIARQHESNSQIGGSECRVNRGSNSSSSTCPEGKKTRGSMKTKRRGFTL